jgi:hypothetical protein
MLSWSGYCPTSAARSHATTASHPAWAAFLSSGRCQGSRYCTCNGSSHRTKFRRLVRTLSHPKARPDGACTARASRSRQVTLWLTGLKACTGGMRLRMDLHRSSSGARSGPMGRNWWASQRSTPRLIASRSPGSGYCHTASARSHAAIRSHADCSFSVRAATGEPARGVSTCGRKLRRARTGRQDGARRPARAARHAATASACAHLKRMAWGGLKQLFCSAPPVALGRPGPCGARHAQAAWSPSSGGDRTPLGPALHAAHRPLL